MLTGKLAKLYLNETLKSDIDDLSYVHPSGQNLKGYYWDETVQGKKVIVAFDNTFNECWIEDFSTETACRDWLGINKDYILREYYTE